MVSERVENDLWTMKDKDVVRSVDQDIRFSLADGTEMLRLSHTGTFFVRGKPAAEDIEVYEAFKAWLRDARCEHLNPGGKQCTT